MYNTTTPGQNVFQSRRIHLAKSSPLRDTMKKLDRHQVCVSLCQMPVSNDFMPFYRIAEAFQQIIFNLDCILEISLRIVFNSKRPTINHLRGGHKGMFGGIFRRPSTLIFFF